MLPACPAPELTDPTLKQPYAEIVRPAAPGGIPGNRAQFFTT